MNKVILGVDVGGTTVKIGMINNHGEILKKWEVHTDTTNLGINIVDDIWNSIKDQLVELNMKIENIMGIGVGAPGFIDGETGLIYEAVNIGWKDYEFANELNNRSGLPVFVENDANVAVLGENWKGAGNQAKNLIAITLGTGVGGGIIVNGDILNGENGMAGEIGHITVDPYGHACNCGRIGCLETIASATGIARQAKEMIKENPESMLANHLRVNGSVTAKDVFDLAKNGDAISRNIITYTTDLLGMIIANMGTIINPSKVLIGGGVSKAGNQLLHEIKNAFEKHALPRVSAICELKIAQLGNDAGMIGAAFLVKQKVENIKF